MLQRGISTWTRPGLRARGVVADRLGADHRCRSQVRTADHARQQSRRGWHPRAPRACSGCRSRQARPDNSNHARSCRRRAVLRRQHDHAGDLGIECDRRRRHRHARTQNLCSPGNRGGAGRLVPGAEARHDDRRPSVRPGHGNMVLGDRRCWDRRNCRSAARVGGLEPSPRGRRVHCRPLDRVYRAWRRRFGDHRRRSAVRRYGAFRPFPNPACLVCRGAAGAGAELLRPGCADPQRPAGAG